MQNSAYTAFTARALKSPLWMPVSEDDCDLEMNADAASTIGTRRLRSWEMVRPYTVRTALYRRIQVSHLGIASVPLGGSHLGTATSGVPFICTDCGHCSSRNFVELSQINPDTAKLEKEDWQILQQRASVLIWCRRMCFLTRTGTSRTEIYAPMCWNSFIGFPKICSDDVNCSGHSLSLGRSFHQAENIDQQLACSSIEAHMKDLNFISIARRERERLPVISLVSQTNDRCRNFYYILVKANAS